MFATSSNLYLKSRLAIICEDEITDETLLKAYCYFVNLHRDNIKNYPHYLLLTLDQDNLMYNDVSTEFLEYDFENFITIVLSSYIADPSFIVFVYGETDNIYWISSQIITIKKLSNEIFAKKSVKEKYELYVEQSNAINNSVITIDDFEELFYAINGFLLRQNWLANVRNSLDESACIAIDACNDELFISETDQYDLVLRMYRREPLSLLVESFRGTRFCKAKTEDEIRKVYTRIRKNLYSARSILDVLCAIYLGKRHVKGDYLKRNDCVVENNIVYRYYFALVNGDKYSPFNEKVIIAPSPFFVRKCIDSLMDHHFTFVVKDNNERDLYVENYTNSKLAGVQGDKARFLTLDDLLDEVEKEGAYAFKNTLIFGNNLSVCSKKRIISSLERFQKDDNSEVMIMDSDRDIEALIANCKRKTITDVLLLPRGIPNSQEPYHKLLLRYNFNKVDYTKIGQLKVVDKKSNILKLTMCNTILIDLNKEEWQGLKYRDIYNSIVNKTGEERKKRNKPYCVKMSPEITIWYNISKNGYELSKVRVQAYVCKKAPLGKVERGNMDRGVKIPGSSRINTRLPNCREVIEAWVLKQYPYGDSKSSNDNVVRMSVSEYYSKLYSESGVFQDISLRTLWYIYPEEIATEYSKSDVKILEEMMKGPIGELNSRYVSPDEVIAQILQTYPTDIDILIEKKIGILSILFDLGVKYNHSVNNPLSGLLDEKSEERKKYLEASTNLINKTFTEKQYKQLVEKAEWHILHGYVHYIGILIGLLTGMDFSEISALKWDDYISLELYHRRALLITKKCSVNGEIVMPVSKLTQIRFMPCNDLLSYYLDYLLSKVKEKYPFDYRNLPIVYDFRSKKDNYEEICPPFVLSNLGDKMISDLGIQQLMIDIPSGRKSKRQRDLYGFSGNRFRNNFRFWASVYARCDEDEIAYLLGNVGKSTLGKHYEQRNDEAILLMLYVKLNRLSSFFFKTQKVQRIDVHVDDGDETVTVHTPKHIPGSINIEIKANENCTLKLSAQYGIAIKIMC